MGMAACTSEEEEISDRNRDAILGTWRCTGYEYNSDAYEMDLEVEITENTIHWSFDREIPLIDFSQLGEVTMMPMEFSSTYVVDLSDDQGDEVSDWTLRLGEMSGFMYRDANWEEPRGFLFYIDEYEEVI